MPHTVCLGTDDKPLNIVTDIEWRIRIPLSQNDGFLSIFSNPSQDWSHPITYVTLHNNTSNEAVFGKSNTPLLEFENRKISVYENANDIWNEIKKELKSDYELKLDSISPEGVYYNPTIKLVDELELLVGCIIDASKEQFKREKRLMSGNAIMNDPSLRYGPLFYCNRKNILYSDKNIYGSSGDFSPPSEKSSLRLKLTEGCSWSRCTFCKGYEEKEYSRKSAEGFKKHIRNISFNLGDDYEDKSAIKSVFIGEGNALSSDTETWISALDIIKSEFPHVKRISTYARTNDILEKGFEDIRKLKSDGLNLLYWGIETGDRDILRQINKGYTPEMILSAGKIANNAGIDLSVMIMPGLGGIENLRKHEKETARVLNKIKPKYVTLLSINECNGAPYLNDLTSSSISPYNTLPENEKTAHICRLLEALEPWGGKIGCFSEKITPLARNPVTFENKVFDSAGKKELLSHIKSQAMLQNSIQYHNNISRGVTSLS